MLSCSGCLKVGQFEFFKLDTKEQLCAVSSAQFVAQTKNVVDFLTDGLKRLEYRGYDSSGIAVLNDDKIKRVRRVGRVANMEDAAKEKGVFGKSASDTRAGQHTVALPNRMRTPTFQAAKLRLSTMALLRILNQNALVCRVWVTNLNRKPTRK